MYSWLTSMSQLARFFLEKVREIPVGEIGKKADLAGISREQMTRWRRGKLPVNPTLANLVRLAEALDLRIAVTEIASGEVVAEAGARYVRAGADRRPDVEQAQERLRRRVKRQERKLGIEPE